MSYLNTEVWNELSRVIGDAFTDGEIYARIYHVDKKQASKAVSVFTRMKDNSSLGDIMARNNIVDFYIKILQSQDTEYIDPLIAKAVNFGNIGNNRTDVIFELLMANYQLSSLLDAYNVYDMLDETTVRNIAVSEQQKSDFMERYSKRYEKLAFVALLLYSLSYGQNAIESLGYQDINEIGVLNKDYIYITYKGRKIRLSFLSFENSGTIVNIQKKATSNSALNYDRQNPIVITAKLNSSRVSVSGYDVTPGEDDFYYNERIFNVKVITLADMKDRYNTIDEAIYRLLYMNQKGRGSFIVSGSDMGVGKSTFMLSMMGLYPNSWGIGILDQQNELQASVKYPEKNVITLVENTKKDLSQCFAYLLKTSRDVMVISEITLPGEVSEMVNAALRLNSGVCATMHSLSPKEVIPNLRNLMLKTSMYNDKTTAEQDIACSLDLIIHLRRLHNGRIVVDSINEVYYAEFYMRNFDEEMLEGGDRSVIETLLLRLGTKYMYDLVMGRTYSLRQLVRFDESTESWQITNTPSDIYVNKMRRYAKAEDINRMFEAFTGEVRKHG